MITGASLIGFALVFLIVSCALSLVMTLAVLAFGPRLRMAGPAAERRGAAAALVIPPFIGLAVTVALLGHSLVGHLLRLPDHCAAHAHHLHLCLFHGAAWAGQLWALGIVVTVGLVAILRTGMRLSAMFSAHRMLRTLRQVAEDHTDDQASHGVSLIQAKRHFCFSAGIWRPRIFFSRASWERLAADERTAVVAHERAHITHGDLWRRAGLGLLSVFGVPVLSQAVLRVWESASERLCDGKAATAVGDPTIVARALVALARESRPATALGSAFVSDDDVALRVEALLAEKPPGYEVAHRLGRVARSAALACALAVILAADPLHHAFETLLGGI